MANYTRKASRGVIVAFLGIALAGGVNYLFRMCLTRKLTPSEYGLFFAVLSMVLFFFIFMTLGLNPALVKFVSEFRAKKKPLLIKRTVLHVLLIQLTTATLMATIILFTSNWLASNYFRDSQATSLLNLFAIMLVLIVFDDVIKRVFQGFQRMDLFSIHEFTKNLLILILTIFFFHFGYGLFSPVLAYVLSSPIIFGIMFPFANKLFPHIKEKFRFSKPFAKKLLLFGLPALLLLFGENIIHYLDTLILTYFRPLSIVGIYNAVLPTAALFLFFSRAILIVLTPLSSELWAKSQKESLRVGIANMYRYVFVGLTPLILIFFVFPELVLRLLFGGEYVVGANPLRIILIGVIFFNVAKINSSVLTGIGRPSFVAKIIGMAAGLNLLLNLLLIPFFGMYGAATSTTISYISAYLLSNKELSRIIRARMEGKKLVLIFGLSSLFALIIYVLKSFLSLNVWLEAAISVGVASAVYLWLVFAFRLVNISELKELITHTIKD